MTERQEDRNPTPSVYDATHQVVEELRAKPFGYPLKELIAWFPTPERQQELVSANLDRRAAFAAETLGHFISWNDMATRFIINRPGDWAFAVDSLGVTQAQRSETIPLVKKTTDGIRNYIDFLIDDLLDGNLSIVAEKLTTTGQAVGFVATVLQRARKQGREEAASLHIAFGDGADALAELEATLYLIEETPRSLPVDSANYDPETRLLSLHLPTYMVEDDF